MSTTAATTSTFSSRMKDFQNLPDLELFSCSDNGQKLREAQLFGKRIVFICCGSDVTKRDIYERVFEHGIDAYLVEEPGNRLAEELETEDFVKRISMNMDHRSTLVGEVIDNIENALGGEKPDAVLTFWDDVVGLTARVAEYYGLVTNTVESIDICHDKSETRRVLKDSGLPSPQFVKICSIEDLKEHGPTMHYPAILKPCLGAASIGVYRCVDFQDALERYDEGNKMMKTILADKELMGLTFGGTTTTCDFILEEFLDGPEVDIDMVLCQGEAVYANVNDDWPPEEPWFCELGVTFPSNQPDEKIQAFKDAAVRHCRALGIYHGVVHVEMKWTTRYGPALIECNPRMGGGPLRLFHKKAWGCDLVTEHCLIMTGLPSAPLILNHRQFNCACIFLVPNETGVVAEDMDSSELANEIRAMPHVTYCKFSTLKGDKVVGWWDGYPSHIGRIDICVDSHSMSVEEVNQYCRELRAKSKEITYV